MFDPSRRAFNIGVELASEASGGLVFRIETWYSVRLACEFSLSVALAERS